MSDQNLELRLARIEAELEELKAASKTLYENDRKAYEEKKAFEEKLQTVLGELASAEGVKNAIAQLDERHRSFVKEIVGYLHGMLASQLTIFSYLVERLDINRKEICILLQNLRDKADQEGQENLRKIVDDYINACETKRHSADAYETYEKARPCLRVVDESYKPDEDS